VPGSCASAANFEVMFRDDEPSRAPIDRLARYGMRPKRKSQQKELYTNVLASSECCLPGKGPLLVISG
jgi:hypothetical protein